jgi:inner membrane protein
MFSFLLLGLIVPSLFSLIDSEIGARSSGPRGRVAAALALSSVVLLWGLRDFEHRRAVNALAARTYQDAEPLRVSAYPALTDPFQWYGVVETPGFFALASVNLLGHEDPEDKLSIRYKPEETPVTLAAKKSYLGRVYLDWAKYPITETETLKPPQSGYIVNFQDLRFVQTPGLLTRVVNMVRRLFGRPPVEGSNILGAGVKLDHDLKVAGDVYSSGKQRLVVPEPQ